MIASTPFWQTWWFWLFIGPELIGIAFTVLWMVVALPLLAAYGLYRKARP